MTTSAIAPISAIDILEQASVRPAPTQAMAEKFTDLMRRNTEPSPIESAEKSTMVEVLLKQDEQIRRVQHESYDMAQAKMDGMSDDDLSAWRVDFTLRVASAQFQFNAMVQVAQSTKNGLQTLMRNQ